MDANQIVQIRGSLTNWMSNNPSFVTSLFSNYADSLIWSCGAGNPLDGAAQNKAYLNALTGDIFFSVFSISAWVWQYQCNLFDSHSTRKVVIPIDYTMLNGGTSPQIIKNVELPALGTNEYISNVWCIVDIEGTDSGNNNNLNAILCDIVSNTELFVAVTIEAIPATSLIQLPNQYGYSTQSGGLYTYQLQFNATDLTLLNAGSWRFIFEISTIPV